MEEHKILKNCIAFATAFCLLLSLAGCGQENEKLISSAPEESTEAESTLPPETSTEKRTEETTLEKSTEEETTKEESTSETETLQPEEEPEYLFFGKPLDEARFALNMKTLEAQGSGLVDLLSFEAPVKSEVLSMIEAYKIPDAVLFDDLQKDTEEAEALLKTMEENRNTEALAEDPDAPAVLSYAILCDNADVRSYPTWVRGWDREGEFALDLFQETRLSLGEGVILLNSSLDGEWLFAQAQNYAGWIPASTAAFCTEEEFRDYLTRESFVVTLEPSFSFREKELRLATILPYTLKSKDYYYIEFPVKDIESGNLKLIRWPLEKSESVSDGYLSPGLESLKALIPRLEGTVYGWGDSDNLYDCSSTLGLMYRAQGIYLPRNTSQMKWIGQDAKEVEGWTDEEKTAYFEDRPGALLVLNGHVMLYLGKEGEEHLVFHETTGYNTSEGVFQELHKALTIPMELLYDGEGNTYFTRIRYIADPLEGGLR